MRGKMSIVNKKKFLAIFCNCLFSANCFIMTETKPLPSGVTKELLFDLFAIMYYQRDWEKEKNNFLFRKSYFFSFESWRLELIIEEDGGKLFLYVIINNSNNIGEKGFGRKIVSKTKTGVIICFDSEINIGDLSKDVERAKKVGLHKPYGNISMNSYLIEREIIKSDKESDYNVHDQEINEVINRNIFSMILSSVENFLPRKDEVFPAGINEGLLYDVYSILCYQGRLVPDNSLRIIHRYCDWIFQSAVPKEKHSNKRRYFFWLMNLSEAKNKDTEYFVLETNIARVVIGKNIDVAHLVSMIELAKAKNLHKPQSIGLKKD